MSLTVWLPQESTSGIYYQALISLNLLACLLSFWSFFHYSPAQRSLREKNPFLVVDRVVEITRQRVLLECSD